MRVPVAAFRGLGIAAVLLVLAGCQTIRNGYITNASMNNGGTYSGGWLNNKPHGEGTYIWANGNKYVGTIQNGKRHGRGTFYFLADDKSKGDIYVGEHKDDKKHGHGTYTFANGNKYVGELRNDKRHGRGTFNSLADNKFKGDLYVGEYKDDRKHGHGTYTFANGNKYVGGLRNGKRHGRGTYTHADGRIEEGIWENGQPVRTKKFPPVATARKPPPLQKTNPSPRAPLGAGSGFNVSRLDHVVTNSDVAKGLESDDVSLCRMAILENSPHWDNRGSFTEIVLRAQARGLTEKKCARISGRFTKQEIDAAHGRPLRPGLGKPQIKIAKQLEVMRSEKRVALVIGNSNYATSRLRNPVNDAKAIALKLRTLGFEVVERLDVDQRSMRRAMIDFGKKLKRGGVGLFYFAGHGVQFQGENYLIPVGAEIDDEEHVQVEGVSINQVLSRMGSARNRLNLVILDACRNNPYATSFRSESRGLAVTSSPKGTYISYAAAPGAVAADGKGEHSPYTQAILDNMDAPGLKIEDMFKRVRVHVSMTTRNKQLPYTESSLTGDFYFRLPPVGAATAANTPVYQNQQPAIPKHRQFKDMSAKEMADIFNLYGQAKKEYDDKNYVKAAMFYRQLADRGEATAQYTLGEMYFSGLGLTKNYAEARKWFGLAADNDLAFAQFNLGVLHQKGLGGSQDLLKAAKLYHRAAMLGLPNAQHNLGIMYYNRQAVGKDYIRTYKWLSLAVAGGFELSRQYRDQIAKRMTSTQLAEAQRLVRAFKPKKSAFPVVIPKSR
jgi:hypothetical protein